MTTNGTNGKNGNGKKREETAARIIAALKETRGLLTMAAAKAGVSYTTINRYVAEFPSVKQAAIEAHETMLDFAEGKLYSKIRDGDNTAIIFYLKTQGKARGYIERHELSGKDGESIDIEVDIGVKGFSDEELIDIINRRNRAGAAKKKPGKK